MGDKRTQQNQEKATSQRPDKRHRETLTDSRTCIQAFNHAKSQVGTKQPNGLLKSPYLSSVSTWQHNSLPMLFNNHCPCVTKVST